MKETKMILLQSVILMILLNLSEQTTSPPCQANTCTNTLEYCYNGNCYASCPETTIKDLASSFKACKCPYRYYIDQEMSHCLVKDQPCPSDYPYYKDENSQCYSTASTIGCGTSLFIRTIDTINGNQNYQCVKNCNNEEVEYTSGSSNKQCLKTCQSTDKPYYYPAIRKCTDECSNGGQTDFLYEEKGTCHEKCETLLNIVDPSASTKYNCTEKSSCLDTSKYFFLVSATNSCVESCDTSITSDPKIGISTMYTYEDSASNIKKCVTDCALTSKPFREGNNCVSNCGHDQLIIKGQCVSETCCLVTAVAYPYQIDGSNECLRSCPSDYYLLSDTTSSPNINKCYKKCPNGYYHKHSTKECVELTGAANEFIVQNDESQTLYAKCPPTAPYYIDADSSKNHTCFSSSKGCSDTEKNPDIDFIYSDKSDIYKCIKECPTAQTLITDDNICLTGLTYCPLSYPYRNATICYKERCPEEMDYYINDNKERICYSLETGCPDGFIYIQNRECVKSCNTYDYPFTIKSTGSSGTNDLVLGYCFPSLEGCFNKGYYYFDGTQSVKECKRFSDLTSPNDLVIQNDTSTNIPYRRELGTLVSECPSDFPYKSDKVCYRDGCPSGTYANFTDIETTSFPIDCLDCGTGVYKYKYKNYCVDECKSTNYKFLNDTECVEKCPDEYKFFYSTNYECKSSCEKGHAYNPLTFECLSTSCLNVPEYQFFPNISSTDDPAPCLKECEPDKKYHEPRRKCYSECNQDPDLIAADQTADFFLSSSDPKRCVKSCETWEKVGNDSVCTSECEATDFYYIDANKKPRCVKDFEGCTGADNTLKVYSSTTRQCLKTCPKLEYYQYGDACYQKCPPEAEKFSVSSNGPNQCNATCIGFEDEYSIEGSNQCYNECPIERNFVVNGSHLCLEHCPKEYPFYLKENDKKHYTCFSSCIEAGKFGLDEKCVDACGINGYKKYLFEGNNTCLSRCPDEMPYYEVDKNNNNSVCKSRCPEEKKYISPYNECLEDCPYNAPFIGKDNKCKGGCDPIIDGEYYYLINVLTSPDYNTTKCLRYCNESDEFKFTVHGSHQCVNVSCPDGYFATPENMCYESCLLDPVYSFTLSDRCVRECNETFNSYFKDKVCVENCVSTAYPSNDTRDEFGACVMHCHYDEGSKYKFSINGTDQKCFESCQAAGASEDQRKYSQKDYMCVSKCPEDEPFLSPGGICSSKCDLNSANKYAMPSNESGNYKDYVCEAGCTAGMFYYETDYICLHNCSEGHEGFNIYGTQKCTKTCPDEGNKYRYILANSESSTPRFTQDTCLEFCNDFSKDSSSGDLFFTLENKSCANNCSLAFKFYLDSDKVCLPKCPDNSLYNNDRQNTSTLFQCVSECQPPTQFLTNKGTCETKCDPLSEYVYYFESDHICRKSCGDYFVDESTKICATSCPSTMPYANNTMCTDQCPDTKQYVVHSFVQGEVDIQRKCLTDCPKQYPYTAEFTDANSNTVQGCFGSCLTASSKTSKTYPYFESDPDPLRTTKKCLGECNGFIGNDGECLKKCPDDLPYYDEGKQCYKTCPSNSSIHEVDSFECKTNCSDADSFVDYETNVCVKYCQANQYWGQLEGEPKYCLNECNKKYGTKLTSDFRCIGSCSEAGNDYIVDTATDKCVCKNLFYIDEGTGLMKCINYEIPTCLEASIFPSGQYTKYKYTVEGTKECVGICKTISTGDFICLNKDSQCPENSYLYNYPDGSKTCKCSFKYYINTNGQTICLGEYANCPSGFNNIIVSTKQCIKEVCDGGDHTSLKALNNYCVEECPNGFTALSGQCQCDKNWYKELVNADYQFFCLQTDLNCNEKYPLLVTATRECIKKCMNSEQDRNGYYIVYGKTCVNSCPDNTEQIKLPNTDPLYEYSNYACRCKNLWYTSLSEVNGTVCTTDLSESGHCSQYDGLYYQIKETRECVYKCPEDHPYSFNDECYTECAQGKIYGKKLKEVDDKTKKECTCEKVWRWTDSNHTFIECAEECDAGELRINATNECIMSDQCPPENKLKFNNICYKDKCPENSYYDTSYANECRCEGLWYYLDQNDTIKYCMSKEDKVCPINKPNIKYQIINTKQCTNRTHCEQDDLDLYIFNFECYYKECPTNAIKDTTNAHTCKCNELSGYWFHEMKEDDYLTCGRDVCPENKAIIINGTKECVHDCGQAGKYNVYFGNRCYNLTDCPENSIKVGVVEGIIECEPRSLDNAVDKVDLAKVLSENIDKYYTGNTTSDYIYKGHNVSLQVYAVNKNRMSEAESLRRADMTYLDLSKCIDKIYKANGLAEEENVIVVKYDVLDTSKAYMINSVEYELYSSKDYKKIDPAICEAKSLVISYPVTYSISKFDGDGGKEYNTYKKVFNLAKELKEENDEYDLYNSSSPIYKDPCISCEIDGKDLVLESRADYLYPSSAVCENNCTYNSTDFEKERINCLCSPKEQFDMNRSLPSANYNFSKDELKDNQGGSSNLPVFTCLPLDGKSKIAKNGGFYYMVFATAIETGLVVVSFVLGYGKAIAKIGTSLQINPGVPSTANPPKDGASINTNNQDNRYLDSKSNMKEENNNNRQADQNAGNSQQLSSEGVISIKKIAPKKSKRTISNKGAGDKLPIYEEKPEEEDSDSEASNYKDLTAENLFKDIKNEQRILRFSYNKSSRIDDSSALTMILANILDKIYLTKTLFFLRKYDILSAFLSLYVLYHVLLLTILAFFFDIDTIKKIWDENNFPNIGWYLGYGLLGNLIVWIIYKMFYCLLSNNDKIEGLIYLKYNVAKKEYYKNKKALSSEELLYEKYQKVTSQIKFKMIIYYILCFVLFIFSFIYLTAFCGTYTGTKKRVFKCYGISILEILLIKIVYGILLGALRKASIDSKIKTLYNIVRFFNVYLC